MINYNRLAYQLKREIKKFTYKVTKGLTIPKSKLVFRMLYGMLESQSTHLSKISRALKEDITLKKTIERLSRGLGRFNENEIMMENYMDMLDSGSRWKYRCDNDRISSAGNSCTCKGIQNAHAGIYRESIQARKRIM